MSLTMDDTEPNEYKGMDILALRNLLEYNTDIKERRKIRAAIREAKLSGNSLGRDHGGTTDRLRQADGQTRPCSVGNSQDTHYRAILTFVASTPDSTDSFTPQRHGIRKLQAGNVGASDSTDNVIPQRRRIRNVQAGNVRAIDSSKSFDGHSDPDKDFYRAVRVKVVGDGSDSKTGVDRDVECKEKRIVNNGFRRNAHLHCIASDSDCSSSHGNSAIRENGNALDSDSFYLSNTSRNTDLSFPQTRNHNAADVSQDPNGYFSTSKDNNPEGILSECPQGRSHSDSKMAASNVSTVPTLTAYKTSGLADPSNLSSRMLAAEENSTQFLDSIRQRLDRRGASSNSADPKSLDTSRMSDNKTPVRAKSNFLSKLYSQKDVTKPSSYGDGAMSRGLNRDNAEHVNNRSRDSFNTTQEFYPSSDKPESLSSPYGSTYQGSKTNDVPSARNVLIPRGVSTFSPPSIVVDSVNTGPNDAALSNNQVRFSDESKFSFSSIPTSAKYPDHSLITTKTEATRGRDSSRQDDYISVGSRSPTSSDAGPMRSESTQTAKSALLKHSPKPRSSSLDLQEPSLTSSSDTTKMSTPSSNQRSPYKRNDPAAEGIQKKLSPPGFPITFPGPRRHSSFDGFSFSKVKSGDTTPSSPGSVTSTTPPTPPSPASPRLGVSSIRSLPSEGGSRSPGHARPVAPASKAGAAPVVSGIPGEIHIPRPSSPQTLGRPKSPRTASSGGQIPTNLSRRMSLPDASTLTKQQILEALKNASDIRNKYTSGTTVPGERGHTGSNKQRNRRLLSEDTISAPPTSERALSPISLESGDHEVFLSATALTPARPGLVGKTPLRRAESDAVASLADVRKSRDAGLRGKLSVLPSSSLLPSKQTFNAESVSSRSLSPGQLRSQNQQKSPEPYLNPTGNGSKTDTFSSPNLSPNQQFHVPKMYSSSSTNTRQSSPAPQSPSLQRRASSSPSIPDIRGFQPAKDQQQHRRRSLKSDGVDPSQDGVSPLTSTGTGKEKESLRSAVGPTISHFTPSFSSQSNHGGPHDELSYSHIDTCESELDLTEMLTVSEDFNERRRIRARMRELKTLQQRKGSNTAPTKPIHTTQPLTGAVNDDSTRNDGGEDGGLHVADSSHDELTGFEHIRDVAELQKQLAESKYSEERHRIRNAIRNLRHADIEQLKLGKPRSGSDPWKDGTSSLDGLQQKTQSSLDHTDSNKVDTNVRESSTSSLSPKLIDLSQYLSQNSASIKNSGNSENGENGAFQGGEDLPDVNRGSLEPRLLCTSEADHDKRVETHDTSDNEEVFAREEKTNKPDITPVIINVVDGDSKYIGPKGGVRHAGDENSTLSVLDQVKAKLRSRSEGLSAQDKAKSIPPSSSNARLASLSQPVTNSDPAAPVTPLQSKEISVTNQAPERRGSGRYREIRDHILGASISSTASQETLKQTQEYLIQQQQLKQQQKQQHHHQQQQLQQQQQQHKEENNQEGQPQPQVNDQDEHPAKSQAAKRRLSKIPVPTWRRSKSVSRTSTHKPDNLDLYDLETRQSPGGASLTETRHVSSSLAAKLSEFRDDLDKEEELLKHVVERRPSNPKDTLPSDSSLVKFVVVGTSKSQEDKETALEASVGSGGESVSLSTQNFPPEVNQETYSPQEETPEVLSSPTESVDQGLDKIAPPPPEFRDEGGFLDAEVVASTNITLDRETYDNYPGRDEIVVTETLGHLSEAEDTALTLVSVDKAEDEDSTDGHVSHKKTSSIKRSRPVRKSATISYGSRDVGQLDSIEEAQESVSPRPVPRKRKSGFLIPRNPERSVEDNRVEPVKEIVVPPPSDFSDSLGVREHYNDPEDTAPVDNVISDSNLGEEESLLVDTEEPKYITDEVEERRDTLETTETQQDQSEPPLNTTGTPSSDSSEFWKRLTAEPTETPKPTSPGRRPLRSSVPAFGNYPKPSPTDTQPEGEQKSTASITVKRRHSDVSNRPNMEQLFSSLLDDLDKASQSESGPSDMELSDGEDLLATSTDSNSSDQSSDMAQTSTLTHTAKDDITRKSSLIPTEKDDITQTSSLTPTEKVDITRTSNVTKTQQPNTPISASSEIYAKFDVNRDLQRETASVSMKNGDLHRKAELKEFNNNVEAVVTEDEIIPTRRSSRNSAFQMPDVVDGKDLFPKEDSGIELGIEDIVPVEDVKADVKTAPWMSPSAKTVPGTVKDTPSRPSGDSSSIPSMNQEPSHTKLRSLQNDTADSLNNNGSLTNNNNITSSLDSTDSIDNPKATITEGDRDSHSSGLSEHTNSGSRDRTSTMNEVVTSSTTLTLAQPSEKIPYRDPPAVSTVKSAKSGSSRAVSKRTFDVNEDEDGSVTYQASSEEPGQNRTVTVRTRRLRTPSDATEELRDTIVERKYRVQRPAAKALQGGETSSAPKQSDGDNGEGKCEISSADPFSDVVIEERDVVRTKKRLTSRGSNYYSRSAVTTRLRRDRHGAAQTVEHDVVVESGAKSVSKGKSWGNRAETHVTTLGDDEDEGLEAVVDDFHNATASPNMDQDRQHSLPQDKTGVESSGISRVEPQRSETEPIKVDTSLSVSSPDSNEGSMTQGSLLSTSPGVKVGMDLSKVSSGYGSGGGSEEESVMTKSGESKKAASLEETPKQIEGSWVRKMGRSFNKKRKSLNSSRRSRRRSNFALDGVLHPKQAQARVLRSLRFMGHGASPPEVVQVLKDSTICEGRQLALECAFSTSQTDRVIWYKDDSEISMDGDDVCVRFDSDTGKAFLWVTKATIFDTALYECAARNEGGEARTSCRVVVKRRPEKPPIFETGLSDVTITEGHSTALTCVLTEAETVAWYKDGIVQRNSSDFKQTFDGRCARLEIGEVFLDDVGEYACVAKNEAGESRSSCRLDVDACGSETTVVPMFLTKMSNKVVNNGDTLRLECDVIGTPEPSITWTKDGEELSPELTFSTCYDGRLATLELSEMRMEDAGTYRCVACNPAGRVSMDAEVVVQVKNQVPFFTSTPDDVTTKVGHSIMLKCEVRGVPRPLVFWRVNGQLVGDSARCIQSYSGGVARLEVLGAALSDGGVYECVARNDVGESACSCSLTVQGPKAQRQTSAPREEQISSAPAAEITVKRRTFKKLSEPRPADVISAVLQRAASSPRGVQRAQSFSPQSASAVSSPHGTPRSGRVADAVGRLNDGPAAGDQLSELSEFSAAVAGNARLVEGDTNSRPARPSSLQADTSPARPLDEESNEENKDGQKGVELPHEKDSDSSTKPNGSVVTMKSPRVEALRLSEADSPRQAPQKPRQTNLGRSASMHTVRNNNYLSPREDGHSPSPSTIKSVWVPGNETSSEVEIQREGTPSSAASLEKHSEVTSPADIKGYRSVSPMLFKQTENNETKTDVPSQTIDVETYKQKLPESDTTVHRYVSEPKSSTSNLSQQPPIPSAPTASSTTLPQPTVLAAVAATHADVSPSDKTTTTSISSSHPIPPPANATSEKPSQSSSSTLPPSSSSSSPSSSPPSSSRSSLQSPGKDTQSDLESPFRSTTPSQQEPPKAAPGKLGKSISPRVSELRLQFLKNDEEAAKNKPRPITGGGVRRWHSLPPQEFKPKVIKRDTPAQSRPTVTMPGSYENITDEEELHKMMNATEDFGERKAIRARLREIRDKQREEMEAKRKEREGRAEDHVKRKFLQAEEQKKRTMEAYSKQGPTHERESKYHQVTESLIQEKQKQADADKAAKMAAYSSTKTEVGPDGQKITTSFVTEKTAVGTVSKRVVEKTGPGSAPGGARPAEETARELTEQLMRASGPGVRGQITVKTESWNSADGKVEKSEKTQTWGAKPQSAKGAMAAFKQMDKSANPAPSRPNEAHQEQEDDGGLLAVSLAKKAATTMRRNAVAIKQEILYFCKMNTQEYEDVEITNFSTSWNNGMAFCALVHHFYPDAFEFDKLNPKERRKNFTLAFDTAEQKGDIAPLLDVEDMVKMKTPDWKCVFTYVQSLYRHLKDHPNNKAVGAEQ